MAYSNPYGRRLAATFAGAAAATAGRDAVRYVANRLGRRRKPKYSARGNAFPREPARYSSSSSGKQSKRDQIEFDTGEFNSDFIKGDGSMISSYVGTDIKSGTGYNERSSAYIYVTAIRVEFNFTSLMSQAEKDNEETQRCHLVITQSERDVLPPVQWFNSRVAGNEETFEYAQVPGWKKNTHELNTADFKVIAHHTVDVGGMDQSVNEVRTVRFVKPVKIRFKADGLADSTLSTDAFFPKIGIHLYAQNTSINNLTKVACAAVATVYWRE